MAQRLSLTDQRFAREVLQRGLITRENLAACVRQYVDLNRRGLRTDLWRVLVDRGFLSNDDAQRILVALAKSKETGEMDVRLADAGRFLGQFVACESCGTLLCEEDFASGEAKRVGRKAYCRRCLLGGLKEGEVFAGFRVLRELGAGRAGRVYLARDLETGGDVALKITTTAEFISPSHELRFLEKAKELAKLDHQNLVRVVRSGKFGRFTYLATEHVRGMNLEDLLISRGRGIPVAFCVHMALEVTEALAFGAERDIPHGDLRPQKLLVGKDRRVRLADLGLPTRAFFKHVEDVREKFFTPPEKGKGPLGEYHDDIYALGRVLCVALTAEPCPPEKLAQVRPDVPKSLRNVIERMASPKHRRRILSVRDLKSALMKIAAGAG